MRLHHGAAKVMVGSIDNALLLEKKKGSGILGKTTFGRQHEEADVVAFITPNVLKGAESIRVETAIRTQDSALHTDINRGCASLDK